MSALAGNVYSPLAQYLCIHRKPDLLRNVLYGNHFLSPKGLCAAITLLFSQTSVSMSCFGVACGKIAVIFKYFLSSSVSAVEHPSEQRWCPLGIWKQ